MPDPTITLVSSLAHSHSGSAVTSGTTTKTQVAETTITVQRHNHTTQIVGASREALSVGDVDTSKDYFVRLKNLDTAKIITVEVYDGTNYTHGYNIYPGEPHGPVRVDGGKTIHLTASSASCAVEVVVSDAGDPTL